MKISLVVLVSVYVEVKGWPWHAVKQCHVRQKKA